MLLKRVKRKKEPSMRIRMSIIQAVIVKEEIAQVQVEVIQAIQVEALVMTVIVNLITVKMSKNLALNQAIQICKHQVKRLVNL